ncbi:ATP-binding protein [Sandarakinorhabdus sp. DWP1-3-1]|uniref:ATP-binding protein n=1 Tax=Sandarakinorhabdus sp. DWP1-3-1 TaxID=2804627 RepID=UPI003CECB683
MTDPLLRIAAALERLSPPPASADPAEGHWFVWTPRGLEAVPPPRCNQLSLYAGVDSQRDQLVENARRHSAGLPAHDVLLWGARGMGKSSLVRAVHGALVAGGADVALVQVGQPDLAGLPALFTRLADSRRRFTVFLDDLSLDGDGGEVHALRSLLDGGVMARPDNLRLVVTSNRRNLVPRSMAENDVDAINPRDVADDRLALADRFGLRLGFHGCDQPTYLAICESYARAFGLAFDAPAALTWAAGRGARSGRIAWQFTVETAGAAGVTIA